MPAGKASRLQLLGAAALFSTGGAAIKSIPWTSFQVAGMRSGIATLAFLCMVPGARRIPSGRAWLVGVGYAATMVLFVLANKLTTAANTIFLQSTAPLYILLLGPWLLREKIRPRDLVFLAIIAAGLALFFLDVEEPLATAPDPVTGNLLALGSGIGWALTMIGLRWLGAREGGDSHSAVSAIVAGNVLAFSICIGPALPLVHTAPSDWALVVFLGVFQIALAYMLVTSALARLEAFEASLILLIEPVLNPLWAWIIHGEKPGAYAVLGGVFILAATIAKTWRDVRFETRLVSPSAQARPRDP